MYYGCKYNVILKVISLASRHVNYDTNGIIGYDTQWFKFHLTICTISADIVFLLMYKVHLIDVNGKHH